MLMQQLLAAGLFLLCMLVCCAASEQGPPLPLIGCPAIGACSQ